MIIDSYRPTGIDDHVTNSTLGRVSTVISGVSSRLIEPRLLPQGFRGTIAPPFLRSQESHQPTHQTKLRKNPLNNPRNSETSTMSQHHTSGNINSFNNTNSFNNVWNNCSVADEKSKILTWLSPLEPQKRHHDIRSRRVDEVGDWLLQTEEYRNWSDDSAGSNSTDRTLFCHGGPGVGKTYIR